LELFQGGICRFEKAAVLDMLGLVGAGRVQQLLEFFIGTSGSRPGQGFSGHRVEADKQIEAIAQRTGEAAAIRLALGFGTGARALRMSEIAAGTGVAGGDQQHVGREARPFLGSL